jgi:hypothetical protein
MLAGAVAVLAVTAAGYGHPTTAAMNHVSVASSAPVLGVDVESDVNYSVATAQAYGSRLAAYIHGTLHAQSLGIVWDFCAPSFTSDIVGKCQRTLSSPAVKAIAEDARQQGMTVELKPIIRVGVPANWGNPHYSWEGFINPANQLAWFRSLLAAETPYLKFLRSFPGSAFVVATEPFYIADSQYWLWLLGKAHGICGCATRIGSQIARFRAGVLPSRNAPGVDWYAHLNIPDSASQQTVTAGWEASMNMEPPWLLARTTLDEEGIRATAGAYDHPESWNINGPNDPQVQARWFTGACQTVVRFHLRGVYFYEIPLNDDPAHPFTFPAFFVGNAGSTAIQGCARMFSAASHRT